MKQKLGGEGQADRHFAVALGLEMERKKAVAEKQWFWFLEEQKI